MRFLRRWVLHNWSLKLLALGLSYLLWTAYTSEPVVEVGYQVPIEFIRIPQNLEISGETPTQVYVRLRGRSALLRRISAADLDIRADLGHAQAGENAVPFGGEAIQAPYGAQVVRLVPPAIRVVLAPRHTRPASP